MKRPPRLQFLTTGLLVVASSIASHAQNLQVPWALGFGLTGVGNHFQYIAVDASGNTFMAGTSLASAFGLGGFTLPAPPLNRSSFVAPFNLPSRMTPSRFET